MKLKPYEIFFAAVCVLFAVISVAAAYFVREAAPASEISVSYSEKDDSYSGYDVSVINSATAEQLMQVSGIGEVKAADIIAYRDAIGGFKSLSQLADISGIGDSLIQKIIEHFYHEESDPPAVTSETPAASEPPETSVSQATSAQTTQPAPAEASAPQTSAEPETVPEIPEELPTEASEMMPVNVNTATEEEIADALLIDPEIAEEIVALREKIHFLSNAAEIYEFCDGVDKELYQRIKSYLLF